MPASNEDPLLEMANIISQLAEAEVVLDRLQYAMAAVYVSHAIEAILEKSGIARNSASSRRGADGVGMLRSEPDHGEERN